jgi:hypothetical protein
MLWQATNFGVQYHHASETSLSVVILFLEPAYAVTALGGEQLHLNEHIYIYIYIYRYMDRPGFDPLRNEVLAPLSNSQYLSSNAKEIKHKH